ncbi:MAG: 5'-3' exonuclease H3TH domain-containing protein [Planctomycetota bacterium]
MPRAKSSPGTVHLIDALPYVFRAYHSLPSSMRAPDGQPINAFHGFAGMLARYLDEEQPTHLAICFDESLNTSFRNELYPDYKSSRPEADEELAAQLDLCQELARAVGAPALADPRYEADDLIGTLCARAVEAGYRVVVTTNDKDLGQLVGDAVTLYDFAKGERLDAEGVAAKLGVRPEQVADFLGLAGDAVDDIPGVKGVGAKSAVALLAAYPSLDAIYADLDGVEALELRGAKSLRMKLETGRDAAFLSRELATIARDAPVDLGPADLTWDGVDAKALGSLLERVGSQRLGARFGLD